jgi:hypothetical protein
MKVNTLGYSQVVDTSWRGLMAAVIAQSVADLRDPDPVTALDAALWLTGDDFDFWAEVIGMPFADGYKLLTSGAARRMKAGRK